MKVYLNALGELNIFGENGTELYGLKKWFEDWKNGV